MEQPGFKVLPAAYGLNWLTQSLALMRAQPGRLLLLAVFLQLILGLTRLPVAGLFIMLAVPALSAGILQAFHQVAGGRRPPTAVLLSPLAAGQRTGRLLLLGALMMAVGFGVVSAILAGSENALDPDLLARIEQGDTEALTLIDPQVIFRMAFAIAAGVGLSGTLSFLSIPLVWFGDRKLGVALLEGLKALCVNWRPYTLLALALAGLLVVVALALGILFQAAGSAGLFSVVLLGLVMLIALAFQLLIFGTQYCSFRDIYGLDAPAGLADSTAANDDQLVA